MNGLAKKIKQGNKLGILTRKDIFNNPDNSRGMFSDLTKDEITLFKALKTYQYKLIVEPNPNMTFDDIFRGVEEVARQCEWDTSDCSTNKDIYLKFMQDSNTRDIIGVTPSFSQWFSEHAISIQSFQTTYVDRDVPLGLSICFEETGYFLSIICNDCRKAADAVRMYLVLVSKGLPVCFPNADKIYDIMEGTERVLVIPKELMGGKAVDVLPANTFISEFLRIDDVKDVEFPCKAEWQEISV